MAPQYFYTFDILNKLNLDYKIVDVQHYGSTVYGTRTEKSDIDIIVVCDSQEDLYVIYQSKDYPELADYPTDIDLHVISVRSFQELLDEHDIMALETYYQMYEDGKELFKFTLDLDTLRRKISAVVNNSWSKARKKLDIPEEDEYLGLKSLFHSIRILSYGIDIAKDGKIDFKNVLINGKKISCSNFWHRIRQKYESGWRWKEFKAEYTSLQNSNASTFRLLAPKVL